MTACKGYRVIEMSAMVTAPLAGQLLADLGAEVIKVEPITGEIMRGIPPVYNGVSAAFAQWNRNKKSVTLNLKQREGLEAARRLIETADVLLTNFRPGVLKGYGLDYDTVAKTNPRLIYAALSGFGPDGPYSDQPAYDMVVQGLTGFMPVQGGSGEPQAVRSTIVDKVTGYSAALAIMAALLHRENSGSGQRIDVAMMDAHAAFMLPETVYSMCLLDAPPSKPWTADLYTTIELKDGRAIGYVLTEQQFRDTCKAFGREDLLADPRFKDTSQRNFNQIPLMREIESAVQHMTRAEFMEIAHRESVPFGPVNNIEQLMADPQAKHNETFVEFHDDRVGRVRLLNSYARFSETPVNARALPPEAGAHTVEILSELGFSDSQIAAARSN